ncbi:hypothetical protein KI809_15545 [Geobacter pelophilus]|uniref:Inhibitor of sigma-G Gin n=1 Tax=Geoanaerobacter pelophilus TaxID=60036 RepID=A0AAW4L9J1_9BACT|nr:hypothetical protein [Geoanaerobacter pelophilus]MBT0665723.1 hypothetical protein [Geoanaerobacter pelophilus]
MEEQLQCPACQGTNIEEDREIPGLVFKVCACCGETIAMKSERIKTLADAVREHSRLYRIKEAA